MEYNINRKIETLIDQCKWTSDVSYGELTRFAELIIRECITQCENIGEIAEQTNHGEMARKTKATTNGCAQMIKWRFDIK